MSYFDFMTGIPISFVLVEPEKKIITLNIIPSFEALVVQSNQYQGTSKSMKIHKA